MSEAAVRLVSMDADRVEVELPYAEDLATAGDVLHGGAISSLIDTAAAQAGKSICFCDVDVRHEADVPVANALVSYRLG